MISRDKSRLGRDQSGPYENGQIKLDCVVGTRCIASAAQFIERNLDESLVQAVFNMISRDKSRSGRDTSGPYENCRHQ